MNIVNIVLGDATGGRWKVVLDYTRVLSKLGHQVTLVVHKNQVNKLDRASIDAHQICLLKNSGHYDPFATIKAKGILKKADADIVVAHCSRSIAVMKRATRNRIPVVCVMHSLNPKRCVNADAFINITRFIGERLKSMGAASKPHYQIPNMMTNINPQLPVVKPRSAPVALGAIGRFVSYKGFDLFLDALKILITKGVNFTAYLAGDGDERDILLEHIRSKDLTNTVQYLGWLPNSDELFKKIDILCVPSRHEPFGLILLEAFNAGIPVVAANAEGPSEICTDQVNALIANIDDASSLAIKLEEAINNQNLCHSMRQNGFNQLQEKYSEAVVSAQLVQALKTICAEFKKQ
ncbi:MAG: glycosyltransferase family 4 protein [Hahellaceae bacterium]|nr:glycosyltransferase family 4 protein [Hahellaceae bacterium]MCP5210557.1 glycosyltransferase family 4 protein [Hahellaceae bacterium]